MPEDYILPPLTLSGVPVASGSDRRVQEILEQALYRNVTRFTLGWEFDLESWHLRIEEVPVHDPVALEKWLDS